MPGFPDRLPGSRIARLNGLLNDRLSQILRVRQIFAKSRFRESRQQFQNPGDERRVTCYSFKTAVIATRHALPSDTTHAQFLRPQSHPLV
jgi:hypothetical protein